MKKIILLCLCITISASIFGQKYQWQTMKGDGREYRTVKNDPMGIRFYTLKNGLTVILSVNKEKPRLQTLIATKAGSKTDPADHTGLAHYLEHMLFKGTDKYGSLDWAKESALLETIDNLYEQYNSTSDEAKRKVIYHNIDSVSGESAKFAIANEYDKMMTMIGAQGTNAFTSFEQTVYVNDIPSNKIDQWLAIEGERYRKPIFRIFHTELEAVYEEKNRSLDNDGDKVFELLFAELFKNHNYGLQTTIGTIPHLKNPSLKAIREYFYKNYVPNNMAVIMVGDMNPNELIEKIDKTFGYMQAKPLPAYTFTPEAEITKPIYREVLGPESESLTMAFRFPGASSKEATMLNFMSSVLSNGNAGLMDLNLVKKQEVLEASAGAYVLKDYGILYIDGKAKEGQKLEDVKDKILGQIQLLKDGKFDDALLTSIINNYKKTLIQTRESNAGRAYNVLDAFCSELDWASNCNQLDDMSKLTKKDIQAFCSKWLKENYVCIYKRIGEDKNVEKVDKPTITPVEVNRNAQSDFVGNINKMPATQMSPVYLNYANDIKKGKLSKVDVLSVKNTTNNLYSLYYYLDLGEWHNKMLPIAVDYLQYLGTSKQNADAVSKAFYKTASNFGVSSGQEETYVYLDGLQENFTKDVALFEDLLKNCTADNDALKEMIAGMKKKRADDKLNKNIIRSGLSAYARYGADNPFNYGYSDAELDNIKAGDLIALLHSLTSYQHKVLYYGPLENKNLITTLTPLHKTPTTFTKAPAVHKFNFVKQASSNVLFADYDMVQAELLWAKNGGNYDVNKTPVIQLFNEYFGGSMSGVVFQDIRESKALAYSTYASYSTPAKKEDVFNMVGYVGCQSDKMKDGMSAMNNLLNNLPESEKMFNQAKQAITNNISTTRITKAQIIFSYLNAQKKGLDYDARKMVFDQIPAMQFSDINSFFKSNIANQAYTLCVLGKDDKMNWDELNKFGAVKKLSLQEVFGY
jgi:predicted Zn-dependent peptidase